MKICVYIEKGITFAETLNKILMTHERNWSHDPIKMKAKYAAKSLFEKYFNENMKGGTLQQFKETYPTLYFEVIIPMAMELFAKEFLANQQRDELLDYIERIHIQRLRSGNVIDANNLVFHDISIPKAVKEYRLQKALDSEKISILSGTKNFKF
jgi:hypothetical protein